MPLEKQLTSALAAEITEWNGYFDQHFHHETGWAPDADGVWFAAHGRALCERAQAELGPDYVLLYEVRDGLSPWG